MIVTLLMPSFSDALYFIVDTDPKNLVHIESGRRSSGLFYFGGSILSIFNSLLVIILMMMYREGDSNIRKILNLSAIGILALCIFISGRLGVFFMLSVLMISLFLPYKFSYINKKLLILSSALFLLFLIVVISTYGDNISVLINWAFEFFQDTDKLINFFSDSNYSRMFIFPKDILFGDGVYGRHSNIASVDSDLGFIQIIYYSGLSGLILFFLALVLLYLSVVMSGSKRIYKFMFYICLLAFIIGNLKDIYLFTSQGVTQLLMLLYCVAIKSDHKLMVNYEKNRDQCKF
ncbi:hypothetical protein [Vibrio algivorus]|uniref:O-antigen ligase family protein n=1 Tax=Vibrio algivorus TaxID=1667024 RepID=A0ABQ6EJF1_9VIBR|nr:hypothetical protein [Vibrio algivorus]GLT13180.1 hypothetical protein GCM10007931_01540 [Vibrio algivorus]